MSYKHILVAIDLTPESEILLEKCVALAKPLDAEVSVIHVEADYEEACRSTGFIDTDLVEGHTQAIQRAVDQLKEITAKVDYPIKHRLAGTGEYNEQIKAAIAKYNIDLVICGHHQGFWSAILSSTTQLINNLHADVLIIPLYD